MDHFYRNPVVVKKLINKTKKHSVYSPYREVKESDNYMNNHINRSKTDIKLQLCLMMY